MLFHVARCVRQMIRGKFFSPRLGVFDEAETTFFCGSRLIDGFMHVNNAKYLEFFELARWQSGTQTGFNARFFKGRCYPVVAGVHMTFLAEIKPFTTITIRTKVVGSDNRFVYMEQVASSAHPKTKKERVHATLFMKVAVVKGPGKPQQYTPDPEPIVDPKTGKKKRPSPALDIGEAFYRMELGASPTDLPPELAELNKKMPSYMKVMKEGDEAWRTAIRARQNITSSRSSSSSASAESSPSDAPGKKEAPTSADN